MATGSFTIAGSHKILNHIFRGIDMGGFQAHLGAFLTNPTKLGPGQEPVGGGYSRVPLLNSWFTTPVNGLISSAADIVFPRSTGWQGNVVGVGIFDSATSGNCYAYYMLEDYEQIEIADSLVILSGALSHSFLPTGNFWSYNVQNAILDHVYRNIPMAVYPSLWLATYKTAPTPTAGGTEPTGGLYIRESVPVNGVSFGGPANGQIANAIPYEYALTTAAWGTLTHWGLHDQESGGNFILGGTMTSTVIDLSDQLGIGIGDLKISLDKV